MGMAFRAALWRCCMIVAVAAATSVFLATMRPDRANDEGIGYFASPGQFER